MFDITSSKLLILGIVALLVIGPKDLPALLRTIGKYVGIIKRQAAEFRAQFEEAMRESELQQLKKEVEGMGQEAEQAMRSAEQAAEKELSQAGQSVDAAMAVDQVPPGGKTGADAAQAEVGADTPSPRLNGAGPELAEAAPEPRPAAAGEAGAKSGA